MEISKVELAPKVESFIEAEQKKYEEHEKILLKEVVLQGVMAIHMKENPAILQEKLLSYLKYHNHPQRVQKKIGLFK